MHFAHVKGIMRMDRLRARHEWCSRRVLALGHRTKPAAHGQALGSDLAGCGPRVHVETVPTIARAAAVPAPRWALVVEAEPLQNSWRMFLYARGASRRLFRCGEIQQIASLPSRGERVKGFSELRISIQPRSKFLWHIELRHAFLFHLGAGSL